MFILKFYAPEQIFFENNNWFIRLNDGTENVHIYRDGIRSQQYIQDISDPTWDKFENIKFYKNCDAIIFLVDCNVDYWEDNFVSLSRELRFIKQINRDPSEICFAFQLNKVDLPGHVSLAQAKNELGWPGKHVLYRQTVASKGIGVAEILTETVAISSTIRYSAK